MPNTEPKHYTGIIDAPTLPDGALRKIGVNLRKIRTNRELPIFKVPLRRIKIQVRRINAQLRRIEAPQLRRIETASIDYLADRHLLDEIPRRSEKKAAIKALKRKAEPLLSALEGLDSHSRGMIVDHMYDRVSNSNFSDAMGAVGGLVLACETILSEVPDEQGGRRKTTAALFQYLKKLAVLYQESTGKAPTASAPNPDNFSKGSPFFYFSKSCLEAIGCPPETNFSLQNAIQLVLSE